MFINHPTDNELFLPQRFPPFNMPEQRNNAPKTTAFVMLIKATGAKGETTFIKHVADKYG
jgi:hypothetical protein